MVFEAIGVTIMALFILAFLGFRPDIHPKGIGLGILTGVLGITGALGFLFAVKSGKVTVVAMFTALSPVVTILLAHFFLNEPITLKEGLGILCAFAAIALFAI
jgi:transporter family protein